MNKADKYYIQNIQKIMSEGSWDENPRPKYPDGDPAYSKFITGVFEEYPTTDENLITDKPEQVYILDRLERYKKDCEYNLEQAKRVIEKIKL